jgi:hypothetical protein
MEEKIAKLTSTIVPTIHVNTVDRVLISSIATRVYAKFHLPAENANNKWIHVHQIVAKTEPHARQVQIIRTFIAHVQLATKDDCVTKILMNAISRHAAMELHAKT